MAEGLENMIAQKIEKLKEAMLIVIEGQKKLNDSLVQQKQEQESELERVMQWVGSM